MFRELPKYEFQTLVGSRVQLPLEKLTMLGCFPCIPPMFTHSGASLQILNLKLQNGTRSWDSRELVLVVAVVAPVECGSRAQCSVCACLRGRGSCVLIGLCQWHDFYVVLAVELPLFSKPGSQLSWKISEP